MQRGLVGPQKHPVGDPSESTQQPRCHLCEKAASTKYLEVTLVTSLKEGRIVENISQQHRSQGRRKFRIRRSVSTVEQSWI